jgi:serine/threonine protein kinase/Tol biopolymer transport system component
MTARWQEVKALFQATVERPPEERAVFLSAAVAGDDMLRREVESLLGSDASDASFLEQLPGKAAGLLNDLPSAPPLSVAETADHAAAAGEYIGPYRITAALGAGGMGEVYRARDSKLHRDVALKILPAHFAMDADRLSRFRREARMLAALNHPNIAAIYGLEEAHGQPALVLELVEGPTLAERIAAGPLPAAEALTIARQIAGALEAAHDKGIIHRDLKPANIKITPAGLVKVLDFGLAKAADREETTPEMSRASTIAIDATSAGVIVGTAAYMSPEQARGLPVDRRTDIWAFGCVLFEMLTGSKAFSADTAAETIATILNSDPRLSALPASTPPRVARVLARCLEKDQTRRTSDIGQVSVVIDEALASRGRRRLVLRTAGAVGVTAVLAAAATFVTVPRGTTSINRSDWVQLTNLDSVTQPALSPDGRMLAFIRGTSTFTTNGQIYVKLLPNGEPVPLTRDALPKMGAVFSPDGDRIAYTVVEGGSWDTWVVPTLRGEPRRWLRNASGLTWIAPDRLLYSEVKTGQHMAIVTADEARVESRDVYVPNHLLAMAHRSYLSPDGKWVLVVEMDGGSVWVACRLVPLDGRSPGRPVGPDARCTGTAWSPDGRWMYFNANAGDGFHIWRQRFPDGRPEQITSGPTEEEGLAVAPDGRSLITSVGLVQRSVWVRDTKGERQISLEGYAFWPLLSADGRKLCFRVAPTVTTGQAPSELWVADVSSGSTERLLAGQLVTGYDVSPDDRVVASVREADGRSRLWLAWLDGREPARRIPGAEGANPRFGKSGDVFSWAADGNGIALFRVRLDGTSREKTSPLDGSVLGTVSPDGKWISNQGAGNVMAAISTTGDRPVPILPGTSRLRWSPDGTRVYVAVQYGEASAFGNGRTYVLPLEKGAVLPPAPPDGFRSEAELAALPGVEILPHGDVAPGPSPGSYAFSRTTTTRNLYRIPLP